MAPTPVRLPFDATFKDLFRTGPKRLFQLLGIPGDLDLLPNELGRARQPRLDWLARGKGKFRGLIFHIEFQSKNDPAMAWRMREYFLLIRALYGISPVQIVIYFARARLKMPASIEERGLRFEYRLLDLRTIEAGELMKSRHVEDNILAVLCQTGDPSDLTVGIVKRIRNRKNFEELRDKLLVLSQLRDVSPSVISEVRNMPIRVDLAKNPFFGPELVKMVTDERQKGREEGQRALLESMLEQRFGPLKPATRKKLETADTRTLAAISRRILDAKTLKEAIGG